jgi:hypothetical protein
MIRALHRPRPSTAAHSLLSFTMMFRRLATTLLMAACPWAAQASLSTDALAKCLSDNTTGKDRKDLARWVFVSMSTHPDMGSVARADAASITAAQRTVADLVTRLLADACAREAKVVVQSDGSSGMGLAFEYLGKVAMQELMSNREVNASISGFERYLDKGRIDRAIQTK